MGKPVRKGPDRERMGESSGVGASLRSSTTRTLAICIRGRHQHWSGRKNNLQPMWKRLMKQVDLEKRTQFLDQVYLGCTQRECKPNKSSSTSAKNLFGSLTSAGTIEKLPGSEESNAKITAPIRRKWKNMRRHTWEDTAN